MLFDVAPAAYDRFMGRYSSRLSGQLADFAGAAAGQRALDVGCGPGALTGELAARLGATSVVAVDPSRPFVEAARRRHAGVTVLQASAEHLPFDRASFDIALAQLVVHFMPDPVAGLREMARVTRPDGVVAASVWDFEGRRDPLRIYWQAARDMNPNIADESALAGARAGDLEKLMQAAGIRLVQERTLTATVEYADFDEWWEPFTFGVGPAGAHFTGLPPAAQAEQRDRCRRLVPEGSFALTASAWAARGTV